MKNGYLVIGAAGALAALAFSSYAASASYEEPAYETIDKRDEVEIRKYPPSVVAEVEVPGIGQKANGDAFRILAGYIFGGNRPKQKIAMTVPVVTQNESEKIAMTAPVTTELLNGRLKMRFYMPAEYSLESLPEPTDKRITFSIAPSATFAALRFSGRATEKSFEQHESRLRKVLEDKGLTVQGPPLRAYYDAPWTPPFLRRNEVLIPVLTTRS